MEPPVSQGGSGGALSYATYRRRPSVDPPVHPSNYPTGSFALVTVKQHAKVWTLRPNFKRPSTLWGIVRTDLKLLHNVFQTIPNVSFFDLQNFVETFFWTRSEGLGVPGSKGLMV